jgi:hypothetical protein
VLAYKLHTAGYRTRWSVARSVRTCAMQHVQEVSRYLDGGPPGGRTTLDGGSGSGERTDNTLQL